MPVSDREREHMRRVGELKEISHRDAQECHLALSIEERLARSWALYLERRSEVSLDRRDDDPTPFYERAKALGLYEP